MYLHSKGLVPRRAACCECTASCWSWCNETPRPDPSTSVTKVMLGAFGETG